MAEFQGTVQLTGLVTPVNTTDDYAVTDPLYGIDGLRSVEDYAERNAIFLPRRRQGMLAYVRSTDEYFKLNPGPWVQDDTDWTPVALGEQNFLRVRDIAQGPSNIASPIVGELYILNNDVYYYEGNGYILFYQTVRRSPGTLAFVLDKNSYFYHSSGNNWQSLSFGGNGLSQAYLLEGDDNLSTYRIVHGLNSRNLQTEIVDSTEEEILSTIRYIDSNTIEVSFYTPIGLGNRYRVTLTASNDDILDIITPT